MVWGDALHAAGYRTGTRQSRMEPASCHFMQRLSEHLLLLTRLCPLSPKEYYTDFLWSLEFTHLSQIARGLTGQVWQFRENARDGKKARHLARSTGDTDSAAQRIRLLEMRASSTKT